MPTTTNTTPDPAANNAIKPHPPSQWPGAIVQPSTYQALDARGELAQSIGLPRETCDTCNAPAVWCYGIGGGWGLACDWCAALAIDWERTGDSCNPPRPVDETASEYFRLDT